MIVPKILASGKFRPEDLAVSIHESNRKINPAFESQVDGIWKVKVQEAQERGVTCYNGITYRLNALTQKEGKLIIDLGTIEFKTRQCLPEIPGYFDLSEEYYRKGCHTLATVKTNDGKYLMVELSGKSMNKNGIDFLGGIMETDMPIRTGEDIFRSLYKELEEEGMIAREDVQEAFLMMVYLTANTNVGFYFKVSLKVSSGELLERFEKGAQDADIKSLKVFSRAEFFETLRHHNTNKQFLSSIIEI